MTEKNPFVYEDSCSSSSTPPILPQLEVEDEGTHNAGHGPLLGDFSSNLVSYILLPASRLKVAESEMGL